jgi:tetratricopeptide (TPR) repeat protein
MKNAHRVQQATRAFTLAETSSDPALRARAKFALGNMYYDLALASAEIAKGGSHQQAVAQIELAREAYKGALRLDPLMYDARFNLELLDRKSPEKRTQAWLQETDGVTLQPFKRNGTAMMKDNTRRGLP